MDSLVFDTKGLLVPSRNIVATLDDFNITFVKTFRCLRQEKSFLKITYYSDELNQILYLDQLKQWINGSFVTKTINPKDVDLVTFIQMKFIIRTKVY